MFYYLKMRPGRMIFVIILTLVSNAALSSTAIFDQMLIDGLIDNAGSTFVEDAIRMAGFSFLAVALYMLCETVTARYTAKLIGDVRDRAFAGIFRQNMREHTSVNAADHISALTNDISTIKNRFFGNFFFSFSNGIMLVVSAVLMFIYQPIVAVVAIASAAITFIVPTLTGKRMAKLEERRSVQLSRFTAAVKDFLGGFEVIMSFGIRRIAHKKFQAINDALVKDEERSDSFSAFVSTAAQMCSVATSVIVLVLSCYLVMKGRMTIGTLMIYTSLQGSFSAGLTMLFQVVPMIKGTKPIADRIKALTEQPGAPQGSRTPTLEREIAVRDLRFGYQSDRPILKGVDLTIRKGEKYALVGDNGSGKTTLIRLLCGYYDDYEGSISYDGAELRALDVGQLFSLISLIHQNVYLFDESIEYNITLGESFSRESLDRALRQSGFDAVLPTLDGGLNYQVGEGGRSLSGGQRQRIAVARALLRETPLLILDEGTSAIDSVTSGEIEEQLLDIPGLTLISITHDVSPEHLKRFGSVITIKDGAVQAP